MFNGKYLIPANSKKSMLILGFFKPLDLAIFATGFSLTFLLLLIVPTLNTLGALLVLFPGLSAGFLVMPVPNYHNVLTFLISGYKFLTSDQRYIWKGWCFLNESEKDNKWLFCTC